VIEPAQGIKDASLKKDRAWICRVMNKVLCVYPKDFLRERIWIRARTHSAPAAILNDGAGSIADDRVTTSLQSQQKRGLPRARGACYHYPGHPDVRDAIVA
jgi:hypothetical protein